jgi:hypothetical protein
MNARDRLQCGVREYCNRRHWAILVRLMTNAGEEYAGPEQQLKILDNAPNIRNG